MNKKAFTLTETLGVIVILSIIALVAIPALTASQGKSDAAYYENLKNLVTIAGKDYFSDHRTLLPANNGSTNFVKLDTLTKLDYIEQPVSTKKNACIGYVEVTKSDRFDYLTCLKCDDYISDSRCDFENGGGGSTVADEYLTVNPTYFEVTYGDPFIPPYAQYYSNGELVRSDIGANPAYIDTTVLTTYTLSYYYRNAEPVSIQVKVIDDIPPSKVDVVMRKDSVTGAIYTSGWTASNVFQIFSATDNESGIKGYEYSFENQPNNKAVWTFTEKNTITQADLIKKLGSSGKDINKTIYVRAVDKFENRGPITSYTVSVDQTKPVTPTIQNPTNENWTKDNFSLTVSSNDSSSGISYYTYTYNSDLSNPNKYANSASNTFVTTPFSAQRNQYVYIQACDNVGLCSDPGKTMIRIDKTPPAVPTINNPYENSWSNQPFSLTVNSVDNESGLAYYTYTYNADGSGQTKYPNSNKNTYVTTPFSAERNQYVYIRACDNVGLCSNPGKTMIRIAHWKNVNLNRGFVWGTRIDNIFTFTNYSVNSKNLQSWLAGTSVLYSTTSYSRSTYSKVRVSGTYRTQNPYYDPSLNYDWTKGGTKVCFVFLEARSNPIIGNANLYGSDTIGRPLLKDMDGNPMYGVQYWDYWPPGTNNIKMVESTVCSPFLNAKASKEVVSGTFNFEIDIPNNYQNFYVGVESITTTVEGNTSGGGEAQAQGWATIDSIQIK